MKTERLFALVSAFVLLLCCAYSCGGEDEAEGCSSYDSAEKCLADITCDWNVENLLCFDKDSSDGDGESAGEGEGEGETDGDGEGEPEFCTPGTDELCFEITEGDLAGEYSYVKHSVSPFAGCQENDGVYSVEMNENAEAANRTTMTVTLENFDGAGEYAQANIADTLVSWAVNESENPDVEETHSYNSITPCTVTVDEGAISGHFDCFFQDMEDDSVNFIVKGAWLCSAE